MRRSRRRRRRAAARPMHPAAPRRTGISAGACGGAQRPRAARAAPSGRCSACLCTRTYAAPHAVSPLRGFSLSYRPEVPKSPSTPMACSRSVLPSRALNCAALCCSQDRAGRFVFESEGAPCPALPCPALPCPALPCPALPCPALPCPALPFGDLWLRVCSGRTHRRRRACATCARCALHG
jgi:hypothetical protein